MHLLSKCTKNEDGDALEIKNLKGEYSLLACFDYNNNGTVDEGEYKQFKLIFMGK